jgi:DNA end-binding protein Ku
MVAGIWSGTIAFGLVSIPVKLHAATSSHDLSLHQFHEADQGRIRYQKICELDDEVVEPEDIVKGYRTEEGQVILLDEDDLAELPVSTSKTIEVLEFVPGEEIDPIHYERAYYAEPGKSAVKPYLLLREALVKSGKIAVVKIAMRQRESLAALQPRGELLILHTMLWPDEIRRPDIGVTGEARQQELEMAGTLIESMTADFEPAAFADTYQEALRDLIDAKKRGRTVVKAKSKAEPKAKVIDLMDALQQSVEQAKAPKRRPAKKAARKAAKRKSA